MKISTKGRYALRLLLDLAMHDPSEKVSMKTVAKRQDISMKYLEQIITLLSRGGYVKSSRGAQGGYQLAKKPEDITVGDVLRVTEGSLAPVACVDGEACDRADGCATIEVWKKLNEAINQVVDGYTLADLVETDLNKGGNYCI